MSVQLDIFDSVRSNELAEAGLCLALETANKKEKGWSTLCWQLFLAWLRRNIKRGSEFQVEDFREHVTAMGLIADPPSKRAFGIVAQRGKGKYIEFVRTDKVRNKNAHSANAAVWRKI